MRVSVDMIGQSYQTADGVRLQQFSTPLMIRVPLGRRSTVSLQATAALTDASSTPTFGGIGDVRISGSTRRAIGPGQLVASLRATLPVGTTRLSSERFRATVLMSRDHFRFRTPMYGQGLGFAPSLLYALPLSPAVTVGIGAMYQHRGSYEPFADMADAFTPGNDIILTGGLDFRLSRTWMLSADGVYSFYAEDTLGETAIFRSGNQLIAGVTLTGQIGFDTVRLSVRYRERGRPEVPQVGGPAVPALQTVADYAQGRLAYRAHLSNAFSVEGQVEGRQYGASDVIDRLRLLDLGLQPQWRIMRDIQLRGRLVYTAGSFDGVEAGLGFVAWLR